MHFDNSSICSILLITLFGQISALLTTKEDDLKVTGLKSTSFRYFIERVVENSRTIIADVMEKAYARLDKKSASKSLYISEVDMNKFAKEVHKIFT